MPCEIAPILERATDPPSPRASKFLCCLQDRVDAESFPNNDKPDGNAMQTLCRRAGRGDRFHPSFLIRWPHRDDNLVRCEGCKRVANRQVDICFTCLGLDSLAGQVGGHVFCNVLGVTERLLVIGEPVEHALAHDRNHDLELVAFTDVPPQHVFWMIDGTDDEDVSHSTLNAHVSNAETRHNRKELTADRRRESMAGSVFGVSKDPFPSWGDWVASPASSTGRHEKCRLLRTRNREASSRTHHPVNVLSGGAPLRPQTRERPPPSFPRANA